MQETISGVHAYPALKAIDEKLLPVQDMVSEEEPLTLYLNGKELVTMLCSPVEQRYLALGFLVSEGMIGSIADLTEFTVEEERGLIWAEADQVPDNAGRMYLKRCLTACCGRGRAEFYFANDARVSKEINSELRVRAQDINKYALLLEHASATHQVTSGVHSGALAAGGRLVCFAEDIGRHNVFDKLYGKCLEGGVSLADKILVFSGRVSSEIILKVSKMGVPVVVARSVPTSLAIDMAVKLGITLIGVAKGDWFHVYTNAERVVVD
ncbi:formate dehydrogenase accessory sulfurtransferase FdhD [Anaerospora sp.]|uniref:formate dehydrogenase accessory sulfurtransferase FdhD n=1 Tax=Anaerospora sp. TaxID=1960278 RepID=UPI0028981965|nr:formate dehydrogenase accessory sulfurtransferase FdhD [Anaerospora sp.]